MAPTLVVDCPVCCWTTPLPGPSPAISQLFGSVRGMSGLPEWPPSGAMHSLGASPRVGSCLYGTSPFGKSVDMVDVCTALMEAGGEARLTAVVRRGLAGAVACFGCVGIHQSLPYPALCSSSAGSVRKCSTGPVKLR